MVSSLKSVKTPTLWAGLLGLVLLLALACSDDDVADDETATPDTLSASDIAALVTASIESSLPEALDLAEISKQINSAVAASPGVTGAEVRTAIEAAAGNQLTISQVNTIVAAALSAMPVPEFDTAQIMSLVKDAVADAMPEGTSAEEIAALVSAAVDAASQGALTRSEMAAAITDALAAQDEALTEEQIAAIVSSAVQGAVDAAEAAAAAAAEAAAIAAEALAQAQLGPPSTGGGDHTPAEPTVSFSLGELNGSGQSGSATLTASSGSTVVALQLSTGATETELVDIHAGQCGDTLGGVANALTSFVDGSGRSVTTVGASLDSLRSGAFAVNTRKSGDPGVYTACGNIPASGKTVKVALDGFSNSDQTGTAILTASGDSTIVTLSLSAGSLDTESVHIHAGQCGDTLGDVAHALTSFVGGFGGSVTTVNSSLDSLFTSGFAINAHKSGDPDVHTACGNIPASAASVTFDLDDFNDSDQTGTATLTPDGSSTIVTLALTTGDLESELATIQTGECGAIGDIVHSLTSFVDGSGISATTLNASLASLRTGNLVVNVHESGAPDTHTACAAIP